MFVRRELGRNIREIQLQKPIQRGIVRYEKYLDDVIHNRSYQAAAAVNKRLQEYITAARRGLQERHLSGQLDLRARALGRRVFRSMGIPFPGDVEVRPGKTAPIIPDRAVLKSDAITQRANAEAAFLKKIGAWVPESKGGRRRVVMMRPKPTKEDRAAINWDPGKRLPPERHVIVRIKAKEVPEYRAIRHRLQEPLEQPKKIETSFYEKQVSRVRKPRMKFGSQPYTPERSPKLTAFEQHLQKHRVDRPHRRVVEPERPMYEQERFEPTPKVPRSHASKMQGKAASAYEKWATSLRKQAAQAAAEGNAEEAARLHKMVASIPKVRRPRR